MIRRSRIFMNVDWEDCLGFDIMDKGGKYIGKFNKEYNMLVCL